MYPVVWVADLLRRSLMSATEVGRGSGPSIVILCLGCGDCASTSASAPELELPDSEPSSSVICAEEPAPKKSKDDGMTSTVELLALAARVLPFPPERFWRSALPASLND